MISVVRTLFLSDKNDRLFTDSLPCPKDYQCGNNSVCVVDPLFPKTPDCKCLIGFKKSSDGSCEGT